MAKKSFKENIQGADKLFSANDKPETEVSENANMNISNNISPNASSNIKMNILADILDNIFEEPRGKNYTFYLTNEVATAIIETAKKHNISNSKLVDRILKKVLLND